MTVLLFAALLPVLCRAQSSFLPQDSKFDHFLERMDILQQTNRDLNLSIDKPFSRRLAVSVAHIADSLHKKFPYDDIDHLSRVDQENLSALLLNNIEWVTGDRKAYLSKRPWFNTFYVNKPNFYEVEDKDFFLAIDPAIQQIQAHETGNSQSVYLNSKGLTLRGMIAEKFGFSAYLTDNQERGPAYFQQRVNEFNAVPGAGYYKTFHTTGWDYIDNRASIYFNTWKYFDWQFGYDKNFIGDGYRSLFLSDYSAPYLFLKFNTRVWKLNYQTIFAERPGSVAAPTAGLHFTPAILAGLRERGVEICEITLEVGLGTFQPLHADNLEQVCEPRQANAIAVFWKIKHSTVPSL